MLFRSTATYAIEDFAYINLQWFDMDLIAVNRDSKYSTLPLLLDAIREHPGQVKGAVVRGSGGHLIARLLLKSVRYLSNTLTWLPTTAAAWQELRWPVMS